MAETTPVHTCSLQAWIPASGPSHPPPLSPAAPGTTQPKKTSPISPAKQTWPQEGHVISQAREGGVATDQGRMRNQRDFLVTVT